MSPRGVPISPGRTGTPVFEPPKPVIELPKPSKSVHRTATTGIAAINIKGLTIHSWAGIDLGQEDPDYVAGRLCGTTWRVGAFKRWLEADVLIIDEISMFSDQMLDVVEGVGKAVRKRIAKGDVAWELFGIKDAKVIEKIQKRIGPIADQPFGGIQVILSGDFFQLPPVDMAKWRPGRVPEEEQPEPQPGKHQKKIVYRSNLSIRPQLAFRGFAWRSLRLATVELHKVFRQDNKEFVAMLNELRWGNVLPRTEQALNKRVMRPPDGKVFKLFARNKDADNENTLQFSKLPAPPLCVYNAYDSKAHDSEDYEKMLKEWVSGRVSVCLSRAYLSCFFRCL
jgi:ATP-dependent DNA helicase PIF1